MSRDDRRVKASKFMSYVLRHRPDAIGLTLDPEGWARLDELIALSQSSEHPLTEALILEVVATNDKQRFRISDDGSRIRASQGHSVGVTLGLQPTPPPAHLFHGTADHFLDAILREGLRPGSRQQVHLSTDPEAARAVGIRHGRPVILMIRAGEMAAAGHPFYCADNGVWLVDVVPPAFLARHEAI